MAKISYDTIRKNTRLTDHEAVKDIVLANTVRRMKIERKPKKKETDRSLFEF